MVIQIPQQQGLGDILGGAMGSGINTGMQGVLASALRQKEEQQKVQANLAATIAKEQAKKTSSLLSDETRSELADTMKRQIDLIKKGATGLASPISKIFSPEARENIAEFNGLSARIEAALLPLVSKGTLAKQRFDYIMSLLPRASDTDATNRGKLKALSRELGVNLEEFKESEKENKNEPQTKRSLEDIFK